jgi:hypothetical protein
MFASGGFQKSYVHCRTPTSRKRCVPNQENDKFQDPNDMVPIYTMNSIGQVRCDSKYRFFCSIFFYNGATSIFFPLGHVLYWADI